jgi:hypothetical protein
MLMTDDEILREASEIEKGRDVLADPRWQALAEGTLGAADRAELEALARGSEDARIAFDAYRPLDATDQAEIVDKILVASPAPALAPVIALRPRRNAVAALFAIGSLAAAAALFLALPARGPAAIPAYEVSIAGEKMQRGTPFPADAEHDFGPGSEVDLVLRPAIAEKGPLQARGFIVRDGRARAWSPPIEISADGAVRIAGTYETVFRDVAPGSVELALFVGRFGLLPPETTMIDVTRWGSPSDPREGSWRLLRIPIRLVDRGLPPRTEP